MSGVVRKNVFVSHHHKDDASVDGLSDLLKGKGYHLRNSSIRVNQKNQDRIEQQKVSENTIRRLLRMKLRWASQLIVVIGKETHTRSWVNWEIDTAHKLGMPIIGVYENGLKDQVAIPEKLEEHGTARVGWTANSVIEALEGNSPFQNPDGTPCPKVSGGNVIC